MWVCVVGAAHRCPFVLCVHPRVAFPEVRGLFLPRFNHVFQRCGSVPAAFCCVCGEKQMCVCVCVRVCACVCGSCVRVCVCVCVCQGRVVGKYVGTGVIRVGVAGHPGVARAQETVRSCGKCVFCVRLCACVVCVWCVEKPESTVRLTGYNDDVDGVG